MLGIDLPPEIVAAINRQTEQYYMIQEYKYRVQREAEESQRKMIEANGIEAFERTVSQGISDSYLRWQGINATLALAQSPNAKIVVIGSGKDGLPIILGNVDAPTAAPTVPAGGPKPPAAAAPGASENAPVRPSPNVGGTSADGNQWRRIRGRRRCRGPPPARNGAEAGPAAVGKGPTKPSDSSTLPGIVGSALSRIYGVVARLSRGQRRRKERGQTLSLNTLRRRNCYLIFATVVLRQSSMARSASSCYSMSRRPSCDDHSQSRRYCKCK